LRASVFSSRTCTDVQARFFDTFFTMYGLQCWKGRSYSWILFRKKAPRLSETSMASGKWRALYPY
jgi:hypothetical protein